MFSEFWNDAHSIYGTAGSSAGARAQCGTSQNPYHVLCTKPSESYQGFGTPDMAQGVFFLQNSGLSLLERPRQGHRGHPSNLPEHCTDLMV